MSHRRFTDLYRDVAYPRGVREDGFVPFWSKMAEKAGRSAMSVRGEQLVHPLIDDFWRAAEPELERAEAPALVGASFSDQGLHMKLRLFVGMTTLLNLNGCSDGKVKSCQAEGSGAAFSDC